MTPQPRIDIPVDLLDQNVGGLEVAMDDRFLMRVLHSLAYLNEQFQAVAHLQARLVAVVTLPRGLVLFVPIAR